MKKRTRRLSIRVKILLCTSLLMIGLFLLLGVNFYKSMEENMVSMGIEQAEIAAKVAVGQIDASVADLKPGDEGSQEYEGMLQALLDAKHTCSVAYLYTLSTDGSAVFYGILND